MVQCTGMVLTQTCSYLFQAFITLPQPTPACRVFDARPDRMQCCLRRVAWSAASASWRRPARAAWFFLGCIKDFVCLGCMRPAPGCAGCQLHPARGAWFFTHPFWNTFAVYFWKPAEIFFADAFVSQDAFFRRIASLVSDLHARIRCT